MHYNVQAAGADSRCKVLETSADRIIYLSYNDIYMALREGP